METIYGIIQANPEYFAWGFGLVNLLWAGFVYFNKQTHDKKMAQLKHSLSLKLAEGEALTTRLSELENLAGEVAEWSGTYQLDLETPQLNKRFDDLIKAAGHFRRYPEIKQAVRDLHNRCSTLLYARKKLEAKLEQDMRVEVEEMHKKLISEIDKVIDDVAS